MLPKSPSMSSFEGDSDQELPCVSLSQSTGGKSELEMPPASEVASLRAREDAAERALQDLRDSCKDPLLTSLSRSASQGSSGEEGEAALSAAVSALQVTEQPGARGIKDHLQLLTAMRDNLPMESPVLNEYIRVLREKPERADAVTELILRGVSSSLISGRAPTDVGVCVCLLRAALHAARGGARGGRARRALHALLDAQADVRALTNAISAAVEDAEQLLAAHDAVHNGAGRGADQLAAALLAHATARVLPRQDTSTDTEPPAPLSSETVSLVRSSWRKLSTRAQLTLLRCAGRALAAAEDIRDKADIEDKGDTEDMNVIATVDPVNITTEDTRLAEDTEGIKSTKSIDVSKPTENTESTRVVEKEGGAALLAALSQPLPRASAFHIERQQVLTTVSKLQTLFRSRFVPDSENDMLVETHFNCSQNSLDESIDTPIKEETPIKQESTNMTPMKLEIKVKIPMKLVTPMRLENPIKMPVKMEPMKDLTINNLSYDSPMKDPPNDPSINDPLMKAPPIGLSVKGMKAGTQLKLDGFFKQIAPVKVEKEDDEHSPDRKRIRRERHERRCAQRSRRS